MKVKAKSDFNYGGIVVMNKNDVREVADVEAHKLINMGLVEGVKISHKKRKTK